MNILFNIKSHKSKALENIVKNEKAFIHMPLTWIKTFYFLRVTWIEFFDYIK